MVQSAPHTDTFEDRNRRFYVTLHFNNFVKWVTWYFEEGVVALQRGWCGTLKRVLWHFKEGGMVL